MRFDVSVFARLGERVFLPCRPEMMVVSKACGFLGRTTSVGLVVILSLSACSSSSPHPSGQSSPSASEKLNVVALGDSDATGSGDPTGKGWVGRYASLLQQKLGLHAHVTNLAMDGKTSDQLLSELQSDQSARQTVANADIVLIGIGGADLNAGDANLEAGSCNGKACYVPVLRKFGRNFDAIVAEVRHLRDSPTVLRAITLANVFPGAGSVLPPFVTGDLTLYQAATERDLICQTMAKYRGRCVDVLRSFNGPSGMKNAYKSGLMNREACCYPSAKGQQLIADLLFKTGLAPIRS
jgi:lysophospholipase L1-like esterase